MTILELEAQFHELAMLAKSILSIEYDQVQYLGRVLRLSLCMATQSLVAAGRYFSRVSNHV